MSELCVRSKASWGYDEAFMAFARVVLEVRPEQIAAGDVWVATAADGSVAGVVAIGPSEQPDTLDLDKLFIEPQRARTGVGRALIARAIIEARRRGANRMTILADPNAAGSTNAMAPAGSARRHPMPSPADRYRSTK